MTVLNFFLLWLYHISQAIRFPLLLFAAFQVLLLLAFLTRLLSDDGWGMIGAFAVLLIFALPPLAIAAIIHHFLKKKFKDQEISYLNMKFTVLAYGSYLAMTIFFNGIALLFSIYPTPEYFLWGLFYQTISVYGTGTLIGFLLITTFPPIAKWLFDENRNKLVFYGAAFAIMVLSARHLGWHIASLLQVIIS